jgi:hypothetical protein
MYTHDFWRFRSVGFKRHTSSAIHGAPKQSDISGLTLTVAPNARRWTTTDFVIEFLVGLRVRDAPGAASTCTEAYYFAGSEVAGWIACILLTGSNLESWPWPGREIRPREAAAATLPLRLPFAGGIHTSSRRPNTGHSEACSIGLMHDLNAKQQSAASGMANRCPLQDGTAPRISISGTEAIRPTVGAFNQ